MKEESRSVELAEVEEAAITMKEVDGVDNIDKNSAIVDGGHAAANANDITDSQNKKNIRLCRGVFSYSNE